MMRRLAPLLGLLLSTQLSFSQASEPTPSGEAPAAGESQQTAPLEVRILRRVGPIPVQKEERGVEPVMRARLDEAKWRQRLTDPDLDAREARLGELLRRARIDPFVRAFLQELALSDENLELRWTARLGLRELGPASPVPLTGMRGDLFSLDAGVERLLTQMMGAIPELGFALPPRGRLRVESPGLDGEKGRQVVLHQGLQGARIVVTEEVDGNTIERVFTGASLAKILKEHPDLAGDVDLPFESLPGGFEMRMEVHPGGGAWRGLLAPFAYGDRWREARDPSAWFGEEEIGDLVSPQHTSQPVRTDVLGVRVRGISAQESRDLHIPAGLVVLRTEPGTIAHGMGVVPGDVLLGLDGRPLQNPQEITDRFEERADGDAVILLWLDDLGQRQVVTWEPDE